MEEMKVKTISREKMMAFLTERGCKVIGTTEEFSGSKGGIWLSGEEGDGFFDYYAEGSQYELGVLVTLMEEAEQRGWYFEWNDAGTIMCWPE